MDEQAALRSQIAQLSGAIDSRREQIARGRTYAPRGGRARGRGAPPPTSRHRSLVFTHTPRPADAAGAAASPAGAASPADAGAASPAPAPATPGAAGADWVKRRSAKSMALVNAAVYHPYPKPPPRPTPPRPRAPKHDAVRRGDRMGEVLVDGVVFVFDESGTKLVKKSSLPSSADDAPPTRAPDTHTTPLHTSINGTDYVRTKNGNLINKQLVAARRTARAKQARTQRLAKLGKMIAQVQRARQQRTAPPRARELCAYYTRTGACRRGASCPFVHDDTKRALCPGALKPSGCTNPRCLLSHTPSAHSVPHCVHYLRTGECRNGDRCPYTHASLAPDAPLCPAFSRTGWCDAGAQCPARHARECPAFAAHGACTNPTCRLAHVAPQAAAPAAAAAPEPTPDTLFVRDDAAAALDPAPEALLTHGRGSKLFAQQNDFISLDADADEPDDEDEEPDETSSVSSYATDDGAASDSEVDRALGGL
ncbi:hypothetical protein GLX27_003942 [Malassezia furfur]|uniref:C3H1-type domain-containing protein n=1 Tax=Malassezia furfur TaxID=55194 RepID=A0ABY8EX25_MALFU|nr:hypothetical protein GLX27_003942 [Malassezia furfur]